MSNRGIHHHVAAHRGNTTCLWALLSALLGGYGCSGKVENGPGSGGSAGAQGSSTSSATSSGAGGMASTSSTSSTSSAGGAMLCPPGTTLPCYDGPAGTDGIGICTGGLKTCLPDGSAWGPCNGQVLPSVELCNAAPADEDCDGQADENCPCNPGAIAPCYSGPPGTAGIGACKEGTSVCNPDGLGFGPCIGAVVPAVETCATPDDDDCNGSSACNGTAIWSKGFPAPLSITGGQDVAVDPSGSVVVSGGFIGTLDFGVTTFLSLGMDDVFTAKFAADGSVLWAVHMGGMKLDVSTGIAVDSLGNIFVVGYYLGTSDFGGGPLPSAGSSDGFVAKLNPDGTHLWSKRFGDALNQYIWDVAVDSTGAAIITGSFHGTVDFGGGPLVSTGSEDFFVTKLDSSGAHVWSRRFGSTAFPTSAQKGHDVAVDGMGHIVLTGEFSGTLDFGGSTLVSNTPEPDGFLAKLDPDGNHLWSLRFGGMEWDRGLNVAADSASNVILAGTFRQTIDLGGGPLVASGENDLCLAKFTPNGQHLWSRKFGAPAVLEPEPRIAADPMGNVLLGGAMWGAADYGGGLLPFSGDSDAIAAKYHPTGTHVWSRGFGDAHTQDVRGIAVTPAGEPVITGWYSGTVDFGAGPLPAAFGSALFVAKLVP